MTLDGRVVVLDFGLVADPEPGGIGQTIDDNKIAGTPAYMAPEQAAGSPPVAASDFYALGVMLFEALSGKLPFDGSAHEIVFRKQSQAAPAVQSDRLAPRDLVELCSRLLIQDPTRRPGAAELRAMIALGPQGEPVRANRRSFSEHNRLFGREAELETLRSAYAATLRGSPAVVMVSGESGIGKTFLCQAFLDELRSDGSAVILSGRCYERESIPFKGLDPLVDELSRYLRRLPTQRVGALLPRDASSLTCLFPVLGRIEAITTAPIADVSNPIELRRRALVAFLELLGRIRDRTPLVLHLDDVHWIDPDSVVFLREAIAHRVTIPTLFIATRHAGGAAPQVELDRAFELARSRPDSVFHSLELGPLPPEAIEKLANRHLGDPSESASSAANVEKIVLEAGGNPFLAAELARDAGANATRYGTASPSLHKLFAARVARLSSTARHLLECVALAGQPVAVHAMLEAAFAKHEHLDELCAAALVHTTPAMEGTSRRLVECYHDRIRDFIQESLSIDQRRLTYQRLAQVLSEQSAADPELLVRCFDGGGDRDGAYEWATKAGDRARAALAFDHAALFYGHALEFMSGNTSVATDQFELLVKRAEALENAGRGYAAARTYRQAAGLADAHTNLDLRRRAAQQLLITGHVSDGAALAEEVCREVGLAFPDPSTPPPPALSFSDLRSKLRELRSDTKPRLPRAVSESDRLRLGIIDSVVVGLNRWRPLHAATLASRYLAMAIEADDPRHLVRALGLNVFVYSARVRSNVARTARFQALTVAIAHTDGRPELIGFTKLIQGIASYHQQNFAKARRHFAEARGFLRQATGLAWELEAVDLHDQMSAYSLGHYADIARETPYLVEQALLRERVFAAAMMSGLSGMPAWLAQGDSAGYRLHLAHVRRYWQPRNPPLWPDYFLLLGEALLYVYEGDPAAGFAMIEAHGKAYGRTTVTTASSMANIRYSACRAACAVSALTRAKGKPGADQRDAWLNAIDVSSVALQREGSLVARGLLEVLRSARAFAEGFVDESVAGLKRAVPILDEAELTMQAAAARRRLGQLIGGSEGSALVVDGTEAMRRENITSIEAMTEVLVPGFFM